MKNFVSWKSFNIHGNSVNKDIMVNIRKGENIVSMLEDFFHTINVICKNIKYIGHSPLENISNSSSINLQNRVLNKNDHEGKKEKLYTYDINYSYYSSHFFEFYVYHEKNGIKEERNVSIKIDIPQLFNNYYLLKGNEYYAPYQAIDSLTSTNNINSVSLRSLSRQIILSRNKKEIKDLEGSVHYGYEFILSVFTDKTKKIPLLLYYFASYGFVTSINFFINGDLLNFLVEKPLYHDIHKLYFKFGNFFVSVNKIAFFSDENFKNFVFCLISLSKKNMNLEYCLDSENWLNRLGTYISALNSFTKGKDLVNTFESIIGPKIINDMKLIAGVNISTTQSLVKWIFMNFHNLILKKNDMTNMKLRISEYLIIPISTKISNSLYRIINGNSRQSNIEKLVDCLKISPSIILDFIMGRKIIYGGKELNAEITQYNNKPNGFSFLDAFSVTKTGVGVVRGGKGSNGFGPNELGTIDPFSFGDSNPGATGKLPIGVELDLKTMTFKK